jgi:hypothetical protein
MVLTPHAVVGAAIASAFGLSPGASLLTGFLSHFLLDRFPHWDYELTSAKLDEINPLNNDLPLNREALGDWVKIGMDLLLGLILALIFFTSNGQNTGVTSLLAGALGGILPDGLQFLYMKFRREPLISFYRFHALMCSPTKIEGTLWGPFWQGAVLLLALLLGNWSFFIW